nr:MAG TPA: homing endonuclease [Bacteriophage sp.]
MKRLGLTGQKFGRLTPIKKLENGKWLCRCDCGKEITAFTNNLTRGHTTSCGCYREENRPFLRRKDLTGMKFDRLEVLERLGGEPTEYRCKCSCGNEIVVRGANLMSGNTHSCGCLRDEVIHTPRSKQLYKTRLHTIWSGMKSRCSRKKDIAWKWYGAKGVKVCDEWSKSFNEFYKWAYSHGYREDLTIDRIDSNGDYSPDNCRWVTMKEQQNNRKSNRKVTYNGETKTTSQWAEQYGMSLYVLIWRLNHWDDLDAVFNKPVDKFLKKDKYIQYRR